MAAKTVKIFLENNRYSARVDGGTKFFVGKRTHFEGMKGITNDGAGTGARYDWKAYPAEGHWAPFIYPTSICESSGYLTNVNTYDSARMTFGFFQFAATDPNCDFVRFFRRIVGTPSGADYFPDLVLKNGRILRETENGDVPLESDDSIGRLRDYLNPTSSDVEDIEVINAAKLIDGCNQFAEQQAAQVAEAMVTAQSIMKISGKRYGLDQMIDYVCLAILDIRHQGRANSQAIVQALGSGASETDKYNKLVALGSAEYNGRKTTLKSEVKKLLDDGVLGVKRYRLATNSFV